MATNRQIVANRMNASRSCGPSSADGKARASRNAITHGLLAKVESLGEADQVEFRTLLEAVRDDWRPADVREDLLVIDITIGTFMKWRSLRLDCEFLGRPATGDGDGGDAARATLANTFIHNSVMVDKLMRYTAGADRKVARAIATLTAMQAARQKAAPADDDDESGVEGQDASESWEEPVDTAENSCLAVESPDAATSLEVG